MVFILYIFLCTKIQRASVFITSWWAVVLRGQSLTLSFNSHNGTIRCIWLTLFGVGMRLSMTWRRPALKAEIRKASFKFLLMMGESPRWHFSDLNCTTGFRTLPRILHSYCTSKFKKVAIFSEKRQNPEKNISWFNLTMHMSV